MDQLKKQEYLHQCDVFGAIRTIYHLCDDGKDNRKLIGYLGNSCLLDIMGKVGIGNYLVKLQDMYPNCNKFSMNSIQKDENYGRRDFAICGLHKSLENGLPANCAKAVANYIGNLCQNFENLDRLDQNKLFIK